MKEKRTYKRFDGMAVLAVLGCLAVILFESIFIFELYNRLPELSGLLQPAIEEPTAPAEAAPVEVDAAVPVG